MRKVIPLLHAVSILWYDSDENQREYQSDFASWHRLEARMSSLEKNLLSIRLAKLFFTLTSQIDKPAPQATPTVLRVPFKINIFIYFSFLSATDVKIG